MFTSMETPRHSPVPSALKWLANRRAHIARDIDITEKLVKEFTDRSVRLKESLTSLDAVIQMYDPGINPNEITGAKPWRGNYGERGALKRFILDILKESSPDWLSTDVVRAKVIVHFGIGFESQNDYRRWLNGSFRGTLKKLCEDGLAERMQDPEDTSVRMGRWRLAQTASSMTLADLAHRQGR